MYVCVFSNRELSNSHQKQKKTTAKLNKFVIRKKNAQHALTPHNKLL